MLRLDSSYFSRSAPGLKHITGARKPCSVVINEHDFFIGRFNDSLIGLRQLILKSGNFQLKLLVFQLCLLHMA